MTTLLAVLSIACHLCGAVFLLAAAIGVIRFPDPLQRMHAATKAGTMGASLTIIGTALALGELYAALLGLFTVLFLFATMPIAAHLLARAIYRSGAHLVQSPDRDALAGILKRGTQADEG